MTDPLADTTVATYDRQRDQWAFLWDSFWGGDRYRNPSSTQLGLARLNWTTVSADGQRQPQALRRPSYLVPHPGESDVEFDARLALAAHVNLVATIVKAYAEGCTSRVQRTAGALPAEVLDDANRRGSSWAEVAEEAARWAGLYSMVFGVVDAPKKAGERTVAEEAASGVRPYVLLVHPPAVAWLRAESSGRLVEFAYTDAPYVPDTATSAAALDREVRVRVWRAATGDDPGGWRLLRGRARFDASLAAQASALEEVDGGPLPDALGGELPVEPLFYERDTSTPVPMGTSVAADAADLARLIYNTLSWVSEIHRKAAFPFLAIPMASTGGQLDAQTAIAVGPSKGLGYNATAGAPSWVAPSSESPRELREHAVFLFQLALRVAGLEVAADQSAQVQSGEALRLRSRDFEARAARFARNLQRWELRVLRLLAAFAGVSPDGIEVAYPKRFTLPDLREDLERALALLTAPVEIGPALKREAIKQAADAALSLTDEQLAEGLEEIRAAFAADGAVADAERTAARVEAERKAAPPPAPAEVAPVAAVDPNAEAKSADTALNGAQVIALKDIVGDVAQKLIPRATGIGLILAAFPLSPAQAEAIMGEVGRTFFAEAPAAPARPGAPPPFAAKGEKPGDAPSKGEPADDADPDATDDEAA
jgi:hypothetical protein